MNMHRCAELKRSLRFLWGFVLLPAFLISIGCDRGRADTWLVRDGQPRAEIVIAEQPARMTRLAASELQTYLEKISGATLPIVTEPSGEAARIYVGVSPHTEALGLETEGLKYGAYRMASGPDWLALLGPDKDFEPIEPYPHRRMYGSGGRAEWDRVHRAWDEITGEMFVNPMRGDGYNEALEISAFDDRGTLHAVYAFLHDLGVRWYMPGEIGEVTPRARDILLPADNRIVRPDFAVRAQSWFYASHPTSTDDVLWRLRLGLHNGHDVVGRTQHSHGMKFVHGREEIRRAHPEYYALWDGKRATDHKGFGAPCLSSEELFRKHLAYVRAVFDHYGEPMVSVDMVDGYSRGVCECEDCREQATPERGFTGSMSDYVWGYIDRLAREIYKTHPDRMVYGATYGAYRMPPENIESFSPNLMVSILPGRQSLYDPEARAAFDEHLEAWLEKLPSGMVFTKDRFLYNWPAAAWHGIPVYTLRVIAENLRRVQGVSIGESVECYEHRHREEYDWEATAITHLGIYVTARLWWDVEQDLDAMLEEYTTLFYGPAREEMKAFIEYCEAHWPRMRRDVEAIDGALALLAAAQAAAEPASVYGRRIRLIADYVRPLNDLRTQLGRAREREDVPRLRLGLQPALAGGSPDGRLDDERWPPGRRVLGMRDLETGSGARPELSTRVQVFWAGNAVHFGIRCSEPDIENLRVDSQGEDGAELRQGDFVEILLETLTHSYYRITVSPSGVLMDADQSTGGVGERWNSNAEVAVHVGEDYWNVEIRIPLAGEGARDDDPLTGVDGRIPTSTYPWYFNVGRQRVREGNVERWAYVPTGSDAFEVPSRFAELWGGADLR